VPWYVYGEEKTVLIGLVRGHRTRIGRIKAVGGGPTGCKGKDEAG